MPLGHVDLFQSLEISHPIILYIRRMIKKLCGEKSLRPSLSRTSSASERKLVSPGRERALERTATYLASLKPRKDLIESWTFEIEKSFRWQDVLKYVSSFFLISCSDSLFRFVAHYNVGVVGPFGPVQDVFRVSQDLSGLLKTGQLQVRWSEPLWLS